MDISLIIPCHNLEEYIAPMISTLNGQELLDVEAEVIFVLDDCTDKTENMIKLLWNGTQYQSMQIYKCNVHCCGLAREEGRKYATGKYTWFIDGDDWLMSMYAVLKAVKELDAQPDMDILRIGYEVPSYFQAKGYFSMVWQYIFRSAFIEDIHFTDVQPHEDVEFMKLVVEKLNDRSILNVKDSLYYYNYFRQGSVMRQHFNNRHKDETPQETEE